MSSTALPGNSVVRLRDRPDLADRAAIWFAACWDVPAQAYRESMDACIARPDDVPQWYVAPNEDEGIVAGCGVIENDFHERTDLAPNPCALFVEPSSRGRGLARTLLSHVHEDMRAQGFETLYLVTDHEGLYERLGWKHLGMAYDDEGGLVRLYAASTDVGESR